MLNEGEIMSAWKIVECVLETGKYMADELRLCFSCVIHSSLFLAIVTGQIMYFN